MYNEGNKDGESMNEYFVFEIRKRDNQIGEVWSGSEWVMVLL